MAKLLLVEDDNNLREIYQARLTAEGYDIIAAQNGEEALSVAKQQRPDLIISDVMMPRISGFEMLDILRDTPELRDTKVIMLTALGQAEDQARAGKLGADKYLVKSQVTLEDIVNTARDLLAGTTVVSPDPAAAPAAEPVAAVTTPAVDTAAAVPDPVAVTAAVPTMSDPAPAMAMPEPSLPGADAVDPLTVVPTVADPTPSTPLDPVSQAVPAPDPAPVVATVTDPDPLSTPVPAGTSVSEPLITTHGSPMLSSDNSAEPAPEPAMPPTQVAAVMPPVEPPVIPQDTPYSPPQDAPTIPVAPSPDAVSPEVPAASQPAPGETSVVADQINAFANSLPSTPPPVVTPILTPTERSLQPTEAENDATLAAAMNELTAAVGEPATPVLPPSQQTVPGEPVAGTDNTVQAPAAPIAPPEPVVPVEPVAATDPSGASVVPDAAPPNPEPAPVANADSEQVEVAGKKVIAPINDIAHGPNLDELLAKEVAKEQGAQPSPTEGIVAGGDATAPAPTQPAATSDSSVDPNSIAL